MQIIKTIKLSVQSNTNLSLLCKVCRKSFKKMCIQSGKGANWH